MPTTEDAIRIWKSAVDAVAAGPLVRRSVVVDDEALRIRDHSWSLSDIARIVVVGGGKAGTAMAAGLVEAVAGRLPMTGWINVPADTLPDKKLADIHIHAGRPAAVNEPTQQGVQGTEQILGIVESLSPRDLCIALISGGGSALLPAPVSGIDLDDKLAVIRMLSSGGANINELNTVRKHLSRVKGGGLLSACRASELVTLVLSDVLGDPLDVIASGPTVEDSATPQDAMRVLERFDPDRKLPGSVYKVLANAQPKTSSTQSTVIVLGNNQVAVDAARSTAEDFGLQTTATSATDCEGAAEEIGRSIARQVIDALRENKEDVCLISGGEPTVQLAPPREAW